MAKKYITSTIIDNLTFYTFGRVEREIEGLAERTGVLKSDFTSRLSTLLSNTEGGQILGMFDQVPTLPENAATGMHVGKPALALGERSSGSGVHHDQTTPGKANARRTIALKIMETLEPPIFAGELHRQMREKGGMSYAEVHHVTTRMIVHGLLVKTGMGATAQFTWDKKMLGKEQSQARVPVPQNQQQQQNQSQEHEKGKYIKKASSLPKGEATRMVMKFAKNKKLTQKDMCQQLRKKYPEINKYVWNVSISTLVRRGELKRWNDGTIVVAKGGEHGKPATAE